MIEGTLSRDQKRGRRSVATELVAFTFASGALASRRAIGETRQPARKTMANNPPKEIQTLIDSHINGFNTQNLNIFLDVFSDTAIIIDGIAPYRWMNPNAPTNWLADVAKWREKFGVTYEHLSYKMGFWNVEGSDAYAVIDGTLTITIKGQTVARMGTLAYTFSKHGDVWKIDSQAWGRTS